jgi:hypothetical protein
MHRAAAWLDATALRLAATPIDEDARRVRDVVARAEEELREIKLRSLRYY